MGGWTQVNQGRKHPRRGVYRTVHPTMLVSCMPRGQLQVCAVRTTKTRLEREEDDGKERVWGPEGKQAHRLGMWHRGQQQSHMYGFNLSHCATLCLPPPNAIVSFHIHKYEQITI